MKRGDLVTPKPDRLGSLLERSKTYTVTEVQEDQICIDHHYHYNWFDMDRFTLLPENTSPCDAGAQEYEEIMRYVE